ncbi:MAG: hypothetical protein QW727_00340 [Candidatus Pacearchaeota archaeon]
MKKENLLAIILLSVISIVFSINLVSAQLSIDLGNGVNILINQGTELFRPIFQFILGDYSNGEYFFIKALFLILLFIIIFVILERVPFFEGLRNIAMLVALIVSVLSVRFLSENNFILGLLLPYTTLGIAIATIVPFLIFAYGVYTIGLPGIGRKIAWMIFGIIFIALWSTQHTKFNEVSNYIYWGIIAGAAIMVIMDRTVNAYFRGRDIKRFEEDAHIAEIANLQTELSRLMQSGMSSPQIEARKRKIEGRLRKLGAKFTA